MKKLIHFNWLILLVLFIIPNCSLAQKDVKSKPKISNKINLTANGFKVNKAYLAYENNTPIPDDNIVEVNQMVYMIVIIDSGWKNIDGKAFPGASEKILLSNGKIITKVDDLFTAYSEKGADIKDAKYINLKAVITKMDDKKKPVIVTFKIWDKKGTATITGNYKLFIK